MKQRFKMIIFSLFVIATIFAVGIFIGVNYNTNEGVPSDINNAISFIISIVAFLISLITYFSIDSVDRKNRMDNNVLQAQNYRPAYQSIIQSLNVENKEEFCVQLRKAIAKPYIFSCMQFADWIQTIIDHILFFAYFNWDSEMEKDSLVRDLEKQQERYAGIGSEIDILLRENISLIKHVFNYQNNRKTNQYIFSKLENVRGEMLGNPVSRTVYYDYLGLDYRGLAANMMKKGSTYPEFSIEYLSEFKNGKIIDELDKCFFIISQSEKNFIMAQTEIKDDLLWHAYLMYNLARVSIMKFLLSSPEKRDEMLPDVVSVLKDSLDSRENLCFMFDKAGYLHDMFIWHRQQAIDLKDSFEKVFC